MLERPFTVHADGLGHPEGPDLLPDGRIVFVSTYTSDVLAHTPGTPGATRYAYCGGGTNACLVGSDDAVYVTQNGGTVGAWRAPDQVAPSIQRINPDLTVDFVATELGGISLNAPNDLAFGPDGSLYFTDSGDWAPESPEPGYLFVLRPDGTGDVLEELGPVYPNGIAIEQDGSVVWVESYERTLKRRRGDGSIEQLATLPEGHIPDGFKLDVDGNFWITTVFGATVDIVAPDGRLIDSLSAPYAPLNCTFVGDRLWVTDFGDLADVPASAPMVGRLLEFEVGVQGMPVFRGSIAGKVGSL